MACASMPIQAANNQNKRASAPIDSMRCTIPDTTHVVDKECLPPCQQHLPNQNVIMLDIDKLRDHSRSSNKHPCTTASHLVDWYKEIT